MNLPFFSVFRATPRPDTAPAAPAPASPAPAAPAAAGKKAPFHSAAHMAMGRDHFVKAPRAKEPDAPVEAEIFMADLPAGAVEIALSGKPVKLVLATGGALDLTIVGTPGAYDMSLGDAHFAAPTDQAGLERVLRLALNTPVSLRQSLRGVVLSDKGAQLDLARSGGANGTLSLTPTGRVGADATYAVQSPTACFSLAAAPERDVALDVGRLAGLLAEQPAALRGAVKRINAESGNSPVDEVWAGTFKRPGFVAGGTASDGVISFWRVPEVLDEGIFAHEFGHLVAQHFSPAGGFTPLGWDAAIKADGRSISKYGDSNGAEDFAESWRVYSGAKVGRPTQNDDPATLDEFVTRFPNRAKIILAIANSETAPLVPFAASCAPAAPR
jgi:hypothetical protein